MFGKKEAYDIGAKFTKLRPWPSRNKTCTHETWHDAKKLITSNQFPP
jgi:hypothetical protein